MRRPLLSRRAAGNAFLHGLALAIALLVPIAARAQAPSQAAPPSPDQLAELPIEDLLSLRVDTVYAASKLSQEVWQAPASVTIISGEEIRYHGYRTLTEVLRSVRGLYVSNDRGYEYVGVRGFARPGDYNTRILMLVDGHRLNDAIYDSAPLGPESPIDVSTIDRVEVIRGPSSSIYGTNAFFAVVNIITRSGASLEGFEVEGDVAMQDLWRGRVTAGGRTASGIDGFLSVGGMRTDGAESIYFPEFDEEPVTDGLARGIDDDSRVTVFGSAAYRALKLQAGYGAREKTVPTAAWETLFNDGGTSLRDSRMFVDLQMSRTIGTATVQARAAHDRYWYEGTFAYDDGPLVDDSDGAWSTGELRALKWFGRHRLSAGAEYRENHRQDQVATDPEETLVDDRRSSRTAALYVEDEFRFNHRVALTGGVRWDQYFDTFGGTVNPRVAVILSPFDGGTLKVLHGRAFRAPNPYEMYYGGDPISFDLEPERIVTGEIAWEQRLGSTLRLTGAMFQNRVSNLITQRSGSDVSIDGLYFENHPGRVRTRGVEFELDGDLPGRVHARASWTYQRSLDRSTGGRISNSPNNLGTFVVDAPIGRTGLHAAFDAYFVGTRQSVQGTDVDAAMVSNVTISTRRLARGVELSISARNLFDVEYGDPGAEEHRQSSIPQDGRTLGVRAIVRF